MSQYSQEDICVGVPFEKDTPTQVFFCEYCKIFKDTYFKEHLRTAPSHHLTVACTNRCLYKPLSRGVTKTFHSKNYFIDIW